MTFHGAVTQNATKERLSLSNCAFITLCRLKEYFNMVNNELTGLKK